MPEKDLPQQQRYAQSLRCLQKSNYSLTYLCVPVVPPADVEPEELDDSDNSSNDEDESSKDLLQRKVKSMVGCDNSN